MTSLKKAKISSVLMALVYTAFGILMIFMPEKSVNALCIALGVLTAFNGLLKIFYYLRNRLAVVSLYIGLIYLLLGVTVAVVAPIIIESAVFVILLGIFFIVKGIGDIGYSLDYRRAGLKYWWIDLISAATLVVMGAIFLFNPFRTNKILLIFIGVCIAINGLLMLINTLFVSARSKEVNNAFREAYDEVQYDIKDDDSEDKND